MLHKGNNHSDVFMAQSLDDTLLWETAQWEANKLLQLDEPGYVRCRGYRDFMMRHRCMYWRAWKNKQNNNNKKTKKTTDVSSCDSCHSRCHTELGGGKKHTLQEHLSMHEQYRSPEKVGDSSCHRPTSGMFGTSWVRLWRRRLGYKDGE